MGHQISPNPRAVLITSSTKMYSLLRLSCVLAALCLVDSYSTGRSGRPRSGRQDSSFNSGNSGYNNGNGGYNNGNGGFNNGNSGNGGYNNGNGGFNNGNGGYNNGNGGWNSGSGNGFNSGR